MTVKEKYGKFKEWRRRNQEKASNWYSTKGKKYVANMRKGSDSLLSGFESGGSGLDFGVDYDPFSVSPKRRKKKHKRRNR